MLNNLLSAQSFSIFALPNFALRFWVWLGVLFCSNQLLAASNPIFIYENGFEHRSLTYYTSYFEDNSQTLTIEKILHDKNLNFEFPDNRNAVKSFGLTNSAIWQKIQLSNATSATQRIIIQIDSSVVEHLEIYWIAKDRYELSRGGSLVPLSERQIPLHLTTLNYRLAPHETYTLYLKAMGSFPVAVPLSLFDADYFTWYSQLRRTLEGAILGIVVALFFYNLYQLVRSPDFAQAYFVCYMLATVCFGLVVSGYTLYFFHDNVYLSYYLRNIGGSLVMIFVALHMSSFLELKSRMPRLNNLLMWIVRYLIFINIPISFIGDYHVLIPLSSLFGVLLCAAVVLIAVIQIPLGYRPAYYFTLSIFPLLVAGAEVMLGINGIIPAVPFIETHIFIAMALQLLLLSIGIANKVSWLQQEKVTSEKLRLTSEMQREEKAQFLAQMTHEIRTPMASIVSMGVVLKEQAGLDLIQQFYTAMIVKAGRQLLHTINNVLDFSKIEAAKVTTEFISFDVEAALAETLTNFIHDLRVKGIEIVYSVSPEVPKIVYGDSKKIQQILEQLVHNSLNNTQLGWIAVTVTYRQHSLHMEIADTGKGMDNLTLERIKQQSGEGDIGLGLSIVQGLLHLLDGEMTIHSQQGKGTEVNCCFPIESIGLEERHEDRRVSDAIKLFAKEHLDVVIASHANVVLDSLSYLVSGLGDVSVDRFFNGAELIQALEAGHRWDFIVLDGELKDMNGLRCVLHIKAICGHYIPVLLRANAEDYEKIVLDNYGIAGVLPKLITRSKVSTVLQQWHEKLSTQKMPSIELPTNSFLNIDSPLNILVAEDNPVNQMVIRQLLNRLGHKLIVTENGKDAVAHYKQTREFDLVFMDCEMPIMDGIEATKEIRCYEEKHQVKKTPIVALTAHNIDDFEKTLMPLGFDGALSKPLTLEKVELFLKRIPRRSIAPS